MDNDWQKEFAEKQASGDAVDFIILQGKKAVRCLMIKSDIEDIVKKSGYDVVIKFTTKGLVHIIGSGTRGIECYDLLPVLRIEEAKKMKFPFDQINKKELVSVKSHPVIKQWSYDSKRCAIINITPTLLEPRQLKHALEVGLDIYRLAPECPHESCLGKRCSWYAYNLKRCQELRKKQVNQ